MTGRRPFVVAALGLALAAALLAAEVIGTAPTRASVRTYTDLIVAANRQDRDALRRLCTRRYLRDHPLNEAPEGGVIGLPRNIPNKNFQVWRDGPAVLLCPSNRVGPVFRFVREEGTWRFDGPVGLLLPGGLLDRNVPLDDLDRPAAD